MMVEFERAVSRSSEFVPEGEDDGIVEAMGEPSLVSIETNAIAAVFQSERDANATIIRMQDGRSGLKVRGTYAQTMGVIRGTFPPSVAERGFTAVTPN